MENKDVVIADRVIADVMAYAQACAATYTIKNKTKVSRIKIPRSEERGQVFLSALIGAARANERIITTFTFDEETYKEHTAKSMKDLMLGDLATFIKDLKSTLECLLKKPYEGTIEKHLPKICSFSDPRVVMIAADAYALSVVPISKSKNKISLPGLKESILFSRFLGEILGSEYVLRAIKNEHQILNETNPEYIKTDILCKLHPYMVNLSNKIAKILKRPEYKITLEDFAAKMNPDNPEEVREKMKKLPSVALLIPATRIS